MSPRVTLKRSFDFEFGSGKPPTPAGNHSFTEEQMKHIAVPGLIAAGDLVIEDPSAAPKPLVYPGPVPGSQGNLMNYESRRILFKEGGGTEVIVDKTENLLAKKELASAPIPPAVAGTEGPTKPDFKRDFEEPINEDITDKKEEKIVVDPASQNGQTSLKKEVGEKVEDGSAPAATSVEESGLQNVEGDATEGKGDETDKTGDLSESIETEEEKTKKAAEAGKENVESKEQAPVRRKRE